MTSKLKCPYTEEELKEIRNNFKDGKLICPFCQQELHKDPDGYYSCYTDNCSVMSAGGNGASGTESLWAALTQAKKDLEIATKALEDIVSDYEVDASNGWLAANAKQALEQIKHKEK